MTRHLLCVLLLVCLCLPAVSNARSRPLHLAIWERPERGDSTRHFRNRDLTVDGLSLCLISGAANRLHGLGLALGGASYNTQMYGLQLAGLGAVAGQMSGVQVAGLGCVVEGGYTGLQLAGLACVADGPGRGLQLAGLACVQDGAARGFQLAGLATVVDGGYAGGQIAGLAAVADGGFKGAQVSGLACVVDGGFAGVQTSGLVCVVDGKAYGVQLAGLANVAGERFGGVQLGLCNVGEKVAGVQLGLVNVAGELHGVPLGLVSYDSSWEPEREVWLDEAGFVNLGYRSGSRRFYNLVFMGQRPGDTWRWSLGWGAGVRFFLPGRDLVEVGADISHLNEGEFWTDRVNWLLRARVMWEHPVGERICLALGPSLNYFYSSLNDGADIAPWSVYDSRGGGRFKRLWPGLSAGLRF
ncbi:hypothetical protein LLH00_11950 [bacterium]|nr:hypothetical protein [bacterium]